MKKLLVGMAFAISTSIAGAAYAGPPPPDGTPLSVSCTSGDFTAIGASSISCAGWFSGNLNNNSPTDLAVSDTILNSFLGTTGVDYTILEQLGSLSGSGPINSTPLLYGTTIFSVHVGAAKGQPGDVGGQATAFYKFDAGIAGLDSFTWNVPGLSNAALYSTGTCASTPGCVIGGGGGGVPEPATWAMMLVGFGGMGALLRRHRRQARLATA